MRQLASFFCLALLLVSFSSCIDTDEYIGSSTIETEERFLPVFSGLQISDDVEATISFGSEASVLLSANENILDRVRTEVNNGVLKVSLQNGSYRNVDVSLEIILADLSLLKATDDAKITAGTFLDLDDLSLEASDDGFIYVEGTTENLDIRSSDGAKIEAFNMTSINCNVRVSDGADIEVNVTEALNGRVSDGGDIYYRGNPSIDVTSTDGGEVINAN